VVKLQPCRVLQLRGDFTLVKPWPVTALRSALYEFTGDPIKTWELATMGLLELRRAFFLIARGSSPTLQALFEGATVHHTLSDAALKATAAADPCALLPAPTVPTHAECDGAAHQLYHSAATTEKAVEGVLRGGFVDGSGCDIAVFYLMKMYGGGKATHSTVKQWLEHMETRATDLGYPEGSFVLQLFLTGASTRMTEKMSEWPRNCMVIPDEGVRHLYGGFGAGYLPQVLRAKTKASSGP
jgi:hypothetical protein